MLRDLFSLFPAYAGVIPGLPNILHVMETFPRICGGDPCGKIAATSRMSFSPHMRG